MMDCVGTLCLLKCLMLDWGVSNYFFSGNSMIFF
jgi:hypothetical protein